MPYNITKSDGTLLQTIPDGTIDTTSTNLGLPGPNFVGYGQYLNENLVHLLENFSANTPPSSTNIQGQLWFDKYHQRLNVFTVNGYVPVSGITNSGIAPSITNDGEFWFDTYNNQFYVSNNNIWQLVGPQYNKAQGISGAIPVTVNDNSISGITHNILQLQFGNVIVATVSPDALFVPKSYDPGFPTIGPGITFNSNIPSQVITGNATITAGTLDNITRLTAGNVTLTSGNITNITNLTASILTTSSITASSGSLNGLTAVGTTNLNTTNLVTGNAQITGGFITGLNTIISNNASFTNATIANGNFLTTRSLTATFANIANISATSGNITGMSYVGTTNFATANAQITGGNVTGVNNLYAVNSIIGSAILSSANITSANVATLTATSANINSGFITGVTNLTTANATVNNLTFVNLMGQNLMTGNATITGGNISGITNLVAAGVSGVTTSTTNFATGNAQITGGSIVNLTNLSTNNLTATNSTVTNESVTYLNAAVVTTPSAQITGGNVSGIAYLAGTTVVATVLQTSNAQITGGNLSGITVTSGNAVFTNLNTTNLVTGNAQITGGNVTGVNNLYAVNSIIGSAILSSANITVANVATVNATTVSIGGGVVNNATLVDATLANVVSIYPLGNNAVNLGSNTNRWNTIYGVSTSAVHADLAENYLADDAYEPGTVLMFGGDHEVTVAAADTTALAGVVSTNPAYLMNDSLHGAHVASIALIGRVPCKVIGPVNKGDLLISAGEGYAKSATDTKPGQIVGRSLSTVAEHIQKTIEIVVGRIG